MLRHYKFFLRPLLPLFIITLLFSACTDKSNNVEVIKALEENLKRSNNSINMSSTSIMRTLEDKTTGSATKERADYWFPKVKQVVKISSDMYSYLEELKKAEGINSEKAKELFTLLLKYKEDILSVDSEIRVEFLESFPLSLAAYNTDKIFYNTLFKKSTSFLTSSILTKFQNDIAVAENKIAIFCNQKTGLINDSDLFNYYSILVGQNSSILKPGDELEIKAGIGSFSKAALPRININGKNVELGDEGYALFKVKVSQIPGKNKIPVSIKYFNIATDKEDVRIINVEYTVAKECN